MARTMDPQTRFAPARPRQDRTLALPPFLLAILAAGCAGSPGAAGPGRGGAVPVEVVTLQTRPVEQTADFIGIVKSRRSTTVQPQVEGFITRILADSGDRVREGAPLVEIDVRMQQATVASLESQRAARRAEVEYARTQAARTKTLLEGGAASQAEMEQANTVLSTAEAQLEAIEAQIREQQVALAYHTVSAPVDGIVGDIPVRVGDSVTRSTVLTTIDQNAGLEVYVNVPVQEAPKLKVGLPVHVLDGDGRLLAEEKVTFVSPAVDPSTQSVLAKAVLRETADVRTDQFVRARIVWTTAPALTAPLVALDRVSGRFFVYVVEEGEGGTSVAHQRAVELGDVVGNDYVVESGLKPGEKLVVSGVQKIRDGVPVTVAPSHAEPAEEGR
jgi:RND family efflux transporter MFP subunit